MKQAKDCDVVFINDSSKDNSKELLHVKGATVINLPINLGIGGCIQTGYKYAYEKGYEIAIQYDGDGQHCASYAKNLIDEIEKGYDYVIGSRFVTKEGLPVHKGPAHRHQDAGRHYTGALRQKDRRCDLGLSRVQ